LDWYYVRSSASGTRIKYILGTDSDEENIKVLADQIEFMQKEMDRMHAKHATAIYKKHEEIEALKRVTWYQKLFNK
jgi:outer membrane protein assembly factor BamE (lipoprotein component of BamABCDE complex)